MSTNDVPGANPANRDVLAAQCWAEADDDSLILVHANENGRVIFSVFDMSKTPPTEYRTAMPEERFKEKFTWKGGAGKGGSDDKWTWHDKTQFPWDRIINAGFPEGEKAAFASDQLTAAARVAASLQRMGADVDEKTVRPEDHRHRASRDISGRDVAFWIADRLTSLVEGMRK